jgi:hypothetical protein
LVLVDSSVWIDHLRSSCADLASLLGRAEVVCHPAVIGELACGSLRRRSQTLSLLALLPRAMVATDHEVLSAIEMQRLYGRGLGWIDTHLLASAQLSGCCLWTLDRPLAKAATQLGVAFTAR